MRVCLDDNLSLNSLVKRSIHDTLVGATRWLDVTSVQVSLQPGPGVAVFIRVRPFVVCCRSFRQWLGETHTVIYAMMIVVVAL